jgi:hypothetical protein
VPGRFSVALEDNGYPPDEARAVALTVLPDILRFDHRRPAAYPNGRALPDDVFSARFAWLTRDKVTSDGLKPHDDLQARLPLPRPAQRLPSLTDALEERQSCFGDVLPAAVEDQ